MSRLGRVVFSTLRLVVVVIGLGLAALAGVSLLSSGGAPAGDGFVSSGALLVNGTVAVVGLGLAGVGVALPSLVGAGDSLGFSRHQRRLLVASAATVGGGVAIGFFFVSQNAFFGILLGVFVVFLGACGVALAVAWRGAEVLDGRLGRRADSD